MSRLGEVDLTQKLTARHADRRLAHAQHRLTALRLQAGGQIGGGQLGPPLAILLEGWDAAGKGGAIRRLTSPLDPRHYTVAQFAAPTERERRHHFLWRFFPTLPGWGGMTVFDRTWYGRVLVERVERFATKLEWERAYQQIVEFEQSLATEGVVLVKFWLHISDDEQLRRFREREADPLKRWKLTDEDWRNRKRRKQYVKAIEEMVTRTDSGAAPWHLIAAESKPFARVVVIETVVAALEAGLRASGQEPVSIEAEL
ncbi:MAG: polyphosphate kinase 2 family protein [Solirubrobacteraceae bacterium]